MTEIARRVYRRYQLTQAHVAATLAWLHDHRHRRVFPNLLDDTPGDDQVIAAFEALSGATYAVRSSATGSMLVQATFNGREDADFEATVLDDFTAITW